jgi:hypothetical protein
LLLIAVKRGIAGQVLSEKRGGRAEKKEVGYVVEHRWFHGVVLAG